MLLIATIMIRIMITMISLVMVITMLILIEVTMLVMVTMILGVAPAHRSGQGADGGDDGLDLKSDKSVEGSISRGL